MTKDEPPVEMFKRATAACFRALAERADMDVSYSAEAPGVSGEKVRLPFPSRELPREEVAQVRGEADALALRIKHHDAKLHASRMPTGDTAPALYEALEQARVEALGANLMVGVRDNIAASLEDRYRREGLHRVTEKNDTVMPEVVRLLARTAFTGAPPPDAPGSRIPELS